MAWRPHPRNAEVNPSAPETWATCDSCGMVYNLPKLTWQYQWQGFTLVNQHFLVCDRCNDVPAEFLRTIILPPDPPPVPNARPENYAIDEGLMPMTTEPGYPGDPGQVLRDEDGDYIGVEE